MLKRLRIKFVLINMSLVMLMLGVIFGLLYYSTSRNLESASLQMLESIAQNRGNKGPLDGPQEDVYLPYVSITLNRAGEVTEVGGYYDLSDETLLNTLVKLTYEAHTESGVLKDYNLRFVRRQTAMGQCIVLADMSNEQSTLSNLVRTLAFSAVAAFLAFLGISILLARWAVKPVEEAWRQQKQFIADASHELKTPLTVIMTDAELIHAPDCPEADRQQLSGNILTMSGQMRGLVESLLKLARIESGNVKEEKSVVSLSEIVTNAAMMFEPIFFEKGLSFRYEVEPNLMVQGVGAHLKQVTDIFLDNAQKYASPGGETILRLQRSPHRRCVIEVANQGEEIEAEDLANLFKRFYRADKVRAMNHSYGLGLSIAASIAEEHHGRVWARSEEGYNRFYIEIPLQK